MTEPRTICVKCRYCDKQTRSFGGYRYICRAELITNRVTGVKELWYCEEVNLDGNCPQYEAKEEA